jgi:hypothetical protein
MSIDTLSRSSPSRLKSAEAEFLDEIQTKVFSQSPLHSTALPWDFYFFKLTEPLTASTLLLYTVKEKVGKPDMKNHTPFPMV